MRCTAHARGVVGGSNRVYEWEFTRLSILIVKRSTDSAECPASLKTEIKKRERKKIDRILFLTNGGRILA